MSTGYRVYLGEHALYSEQEPLARQRRGVARVIIHPLYMFTPQAVGDL